MDLRFLALVFAISTPGEAVVIAAQDLGRLPAEVRPYTLYLYAPKKKETDHKVCNGHFQHLSRSPDIVHAGVLDDKVLRVDIRDYGWSSALRESLADADPFYHITVEQNGKRYRVISPVLAEGIIKQMVNGKDYEHSVKTNLEYLVEQTGSKCPLVRADWFFNQTAIQAGRSPGYYDFLGIKTQDDVFKLIGFDAKFVKAHGRVIREAVAISGVTQQPRAYVIEEVPGGQPLMKSLDFVKAVDKANPLRVLGPEIEPQAKAEEWYHALPNRFWSTSLWKTEDKTRQDSAPDNIASDHMSKSHDRRIHVNASCYRCHDNGGIQAIDGFVRNLAQPPLMIGSPDYDQQVKLRREYLKSMETQLDVARVLYGEAVKEATGMDAKAYAKAYAEYWERYEDAKIDLKWAAADMGVTPERLKAAIEKRIAFGMFDLKAGGVDLVLASLIRGTSIGVRQYEEIYNPAMNLLLGDR